MTRTLRWMYWGAFVIQFALPPQVSRGEDLEISLANAAREPLIELVLPPQGSPDHVSLTAEGLLIRQARDVPGRPVGVAGVNMLLPASGDFSATLDCKCLRLEEPSEGWGQGLLLQVVLDDKPQTILKLARFAYPGQGQLCHAEITHVVGDAPAEYFYREMEFEEGSLVISRAGREVTFAVDNGSGLQVIETRTCPSADVRTVQAFCTRLEKGNTEAEFLLRRLRIQADHVLEGMLVGLGALVSSLRAPFEPEAGAYAHGHQHPGDGSGARIHLMAGH